MRLAIPRRIVCMQTPPKGDKLATRYCFRARCTVVDKGGTPVGAFISYDKTPDVADTLRAVCDSLLSDFPKGTSCDPDIELTLFKHCPVECDDTVQYTGS